MSSPVDRFRTGGWSALLSVVFLAVAGAIGIALDQPWVFPSLGPSLMALAETPKTPAAHPRSVLVGHLVGIGAGVLGLALTGLRHHPSAVQEGLTSQRVVAVCIAIGVTALVLQALSCPHPPAGATTLIVALGILRTTPQLRTMVLAVVLLSAVAVLVHLSPQLHPARQAQLPSSPLSR
jgi:CBS-domain-containing membrane protein